MESLETAASFVDGLLDFSSDIGDEDEEDENNKAPSSSSLPLDSSPSKINPLQPPLLNIFDPDDVHHSFPEFIEEDLEWISNVDAFPAVETFMDILSEKPSNGLKRQSPVSVLENSSSSSSSSAIMSFCGSLRVPVRARSKRRRRRLSGCSGISGQQLWWWCEAKMKNRGGGAKPLMIGRKCEHCLAEKTPQWRAGPLGPKTLCNACGVRFKSGRLVPEYRPASSPSFSVETHSNSHRKIMEMRRQKQKGMVLKSLDKG